jgi:hypothetical protein
LKTFKQSAADQAAADAVDRVRRAASGLDTIASFNPKAENVRFGPDAERIIALLRQESAPISIVDLAKKMGWTDADRVAQVLKFANDQKMLALSQINGQTFAGLPPA